MRGVSAPPGECRLSRQEGFTGGRRIWVVAPVGTVCAMRILVVSTFYTPVALGGYEVECAGVVERLRHRHEERELTTEQDRTRMSPDPGRVGGGRGAPARAPRGAGAHQRAEQNARVPRAGGLARAGAAEPRPPRRAS